MARNEQQDPRHIPFHSGCPLAVGGMIGGGIFIIAGVTLGVAGPGAAGSLRDGKA
jgi:L-asparagine transporter-like permease